MFIKITEFAKPRNISGRYVRQLIQTGKITKNSWKMKGKQYLVNPAKADRDMADNVKGWDPDAPTPDQKLDTFLAQEYPSLPPDAMQKIQEAGIESLTTAEALKLQAYYRGQLLKLEYGVKTGKLVYTNIVETKSFNHARQIRDSILMVPERVAPEIAACTTLAQVKKILTDAMNEAMADLDVLPDYSVED